MFGNKRGDSQPSIFEMVRLGFMIHGAMKDIERLDSLIKLLDEDSTNPEIHEAFLEGIKKIKDPNPIDITSKAYFKVLSIFSENPNDQNVRYLVLKIGKWHYASHNPPKSYTSNNLVLVQNQLAAISEIECLIAAITKGDKSVFEQATQLAERLDEHVMFSDPIGVKYDQQKLIFLDKFVDLLLRHLRLQTNNKNLHALLVKTLKKVSSIDSLRVYNSILDIFQVTSSQEQFKILVLEVGRWHFGRQRLWGKPKEADEQAIRNDILVRSK